jgi:hypothetical protein
LSGIAQASADKLISDDHDELSAGNSSTPKAASQTDLSVLMA